MSKLRTSPNKASKLTADPSFATIAELAPEIEFGALGPVALTERSLDRDSFLRYSDIYLRNTSLGDLLGLCAVSVPCGFSADGLPIGLMVYARPFDEATALRLAFAYEQTAEWRTRRPDLSWAA